MNIIPDHAVDSGDFTAFPIADATALGSSGAKHAPARWALVTGEFPDQTGGVSDYCGVLTTALARYGDEVEVWAPNGTGPALLESDVRVHRLSDHFGLRGLVTLARSLSRLPKETRIVVQYVPHAFGWRGMNVGLILVLWWLSRQRQVWVMFHEVAYPVIAGQPVQHRFLAHLHRAMARTLVRAASRVFVSIPAWGDFLDSIGARPEACVWLPIPSSLPIEVNAQKVAAFRKAAGGSRGGLLAGHFGRYGHATAPLLEPLIAQVLANEASASVLLLGQGSETFAAKWQVANPELAHRVQGCGSLPAEAVACRIAACDFMVQPYSDGVSSRRTTVMAALALGVPVVSNLGALSESIWRRSGCVALAEEPAAEAFVAVTRKVMFDDAYRADLSARSLKTYAEKFSIERTVETLRQCAAEEDSLKSGVAKPRAEGSEARA